MPDQDAPGGKSAHSDMQNQSKNAPRPGTGFLGSLRDALKAASSNEDDRILIANAGTTEKNAMHANHGSASSNVHEGAKHMSSPNDAANSAENNAAKETANDARSPAPPPLPSAAEAAREARGGTPNIPPVNNSPAAGASASGAKPSEQAPPTTRVVRPQQSAATPPGPSPKLSQEPRTQLVRGRQSIDRGTFDQDPVVGWLVIVGGPGIGSYRPVFEGNNTIGRATTNRIPINFGDDAISGEEQAYIRYDSGDRSFLLVPNMSKTNIVSVNEKRPTSAIALQAMDVITMGRTQLVFVPFCGPEFDWGELSGAKG